MARSSDDPLVTIITGTYNRPDYLRLALASALASQYQNFELIVTDNANSSTNRSIAHSFGDPRIRYRANSTNIGIVGNYLAAFREMRGEYFAILADDDLWEPTYLAKLVPLLMENSNTAMAFSDHYIIDDDGNIDYHATARERADFGRSNLPAGVSASLFELGLLSVSIHVGASAVIRRTAINFDDFPLEVGAAFDLWLSYLAARSGGVAYYLPDYLTRYRVHRRSAHTRGFVEVVRDRAFVYSRVLRDDLFREFRHDIERRLSASHVDCALALLKMGALGEAGIHLRKSLALTGGFSRLVSRSLGWTAASFSSSFHTM